MKFWLANKSSIKQLVSDTFFRQVLVILFTAYLILNKGFIIYQPVYTKKILALFFLIALACYKNNIYFLILSLISTCLIFLQIYFYYSFVANHVFVCLFIAIILNISFLQNNYYATLQFNVKLLLAFIMLIAVLQKIISPVYMNGFFMQLSFCKGGFFESLLWIDNYKAMVDYNNGLYNQLNNYQQTTPLIIKTILPNQLFWMKLFSWFIILVEFAFVIILFIKNSFWRNTLLLLIIIGIVITRKEVGFATLLILLVLMLNTAQQYKARFYVCATFLAGLLLIALNIGAS